ncbi:MAG: M48 family metalloprotease [Labilithrix sp.]|nr:M48 family metalloprotease [Labilithrix sp.]
MAPPSVARRATVALAVLGSFYVTTATLALALLPLPVLAVMYMRPVRVFMLLLIAAGCWITAYGLITGLLGVRPPRFEEPGVRLGRGDAPSLFAMIEELAQRAGIAPPHDVYVSAMPDLFVTETGGGFLGGKSRRVLCVGAPYLAVFSVSELRAVLAHELGHYVGGDTKLTGVLAYTEGAFRSVLASTERNALREGTTHWAIDVGGWIASVVGEGLVKVFARVYLGLTRPMSRRQELAADALSAALAGRDAAIRALEQAHVMGPLYEVYLANEVKPAIDDGVMPTDLLDGFARCNAALARYGRVAELSRAVQEDRTDPFDTHPALVDRVAALSTLPAGSPPIVDARAVTLLDGAFQLDRWLVDATLSSVVRADQPPVARMTWAEAHASVLPARVHERARETAARLFASMPGARTMTEMLAAVIAAYDAGKTYDVVAGLEPELHAAPPHVRAQIVPKLAGVVVLSLFEGALLERGAVLEDSLGEPSRVFRFGDETVRAGLIAIDAMNSDVARGELLRLSAKLAHASA